jgi:tetratricopeptide (TPR) repeat protein
MDIGDLDGAKEADRIVQNSIISDTKSELEANDDDGKGKGGVVVEECAICLEIPTTVDQARSLPCHHCFCLSCLTNAWQLSPNGGVCPLCRNVYAQEEDVASTNARATLLRCLPLLLQDTTTYAEKERGVRQLKSAIDNISTAIRKKEQKSNKKKKKKNEGLATSNMYNAQATLLQIKDLIVNDGGGGQPSPATLKAWKSACLYSEGSGDSMETSNLLSYGKAMHMKGDDIEAIRILRKALKCAQDQNDIFSRRAICIYLAKSLCRESSSLEEMKEASERLNDAFDGFEADENFTGYGIDFATACGKYAERASLCSKPESNKTDHHELHLTKAIDDNLSRWISAPSCQDNATLQHEYGRALRRIGRVDEAIKHLQRATEIDPEKPGVWGNYGVALRQKGNLLEAADAARKAISLAPNVGLGHFNLGNVLLEMGDLHPALTSFNNAVKVGVSALHMDTIKRYRECILEALRCKACNKPLATARCSRCKGAFFCNAQCQRQCWPQHKQHCKQLESGQFPTPGAFQNPWMMLLLDPVKMQCMLKNEDGSNPFPGKEESIMSCGKYGVDMMMESFGDRIRTVKKVNFTPK